MDSYGCEDERGRLSPQTPPARRRCFKSPAGQPPAWKKRCFHSLCCGDFHIFSRIIFIYLHYFPPSSVKRHGVGGGDITYFCENMTLRTSSMCDGTILWRSILGLVWSGSSRKLSCLPLFTFWYSNMASWKSTILIFEW